MSQSNKTDHYIAPYDDSVSFDELPDSAPSSRYSPSWTGWLGISVVSFWVFIAIALYRSARRERSSFPR